MRSRRPTRTYGGILLQIMEDGVLTDAQGRRVDFRNTVVVMTSNVGAKRITSQEAVWDFPPGPLPKGRPARPKSSTPPFWMTSRQSFAPSF